MGTRKLTINLPEELVERAKANALARGISVSALIADSLKDKLEEQDAARAAGRRFLELVKKGPLTDIDPGTIRREELYDRR